MPVADKFRARRGRGRKKKREKSVFGTVSSDGANCLTQIQVFEVISSDPQRLLMNRVCIVGLSDLSPLPSMFP
jgi:hypothetical protein